MINIFFAIELYFNIVWIWVAVAAAYHVYPYGISKQLMYSMRLKYFHTDIFSYLTIYNNFNLYDE